MPLVPAVRGGPEGGTNEVALRHGVPFGPGVVAVDQVWEALGSMRQSLGEEFRELIETKEELLRMHRASEQILDANRPLDPDAETCRCSTG